MKLLLKSIQKEIVRSYIKGVRGHGLKSVACRFGIPRSSVQSVIQRATTYPLTYHISKKRQTKTSHKTG